MENEFEIFDDINIQLIKNIKKEENKNLNIILYICLLICFLIKHFY
jgi:hypothetical protein